MQQVGIRELKSKLSEYVRKASAGEIILVTERGRVVAQVRAPGPIPEEHPHPLLLKAAAEGKVVLAQQTTPADLYEPRPVTTEAGMAHFRDSCCWLGGLSYEICFTLNEQQLSEAWKSIVNKGRISVTGRVRHKSRSTQSSPSGM